MQHKFWITKQTLSQKLGRKEDDCIVSSDAELDAKLELFRNIQISCSILQRIINKYQESICYLSQETNSLGRFLKENSEDKIQTKDTMQTTGKKLIFCAQQQLVLHEPLIRIYQELETFRQRAIEDTFQNIASMEKARTEFRATLLWMKNVSHELDPDTTKQLEKFKKVQHQVRRKKQKFDKLSFDCLQKIDLLAAARCNMFNYVLSFYQNKMKSYYSESTNLYLNVSKNYNEDRIQINTSEKMSNLNINDTHNAEKLLLDNSTSRDKNEDLLEHLLDALPKSKCSNDDNTGSIEENYQQNQPNSLILSYSDFIDNILVDDTKSTNIQNFNQKMDDQSIFFPSDLLHHNSNPDSYVTNSEDKNLPSNKIEDSLIKNDQTKTWLNLFEDLGPLSENSTTLSNKCNGSFV